MGCRFCDWDGKCELWDEDAFEHIVRSCGPDGTCVVCDDPDPSQSCEDYQET